MTKWSGAPSHRKKLGSHTFSTVISGHLTPEQIDAYQEMFRIEEIADIFRFASTRRRQVTSILPSGNLEANPNYRRDPSPPPRYNARGSRINTREARTVEAMQREQNYLVEMAVRDVLGYNPPVEYNKPQKNSEKFYIPAVDYPHINFVGLLLGPRAQTLVEMQEKSGAKLAIRGKGSVKDGRHTSDNPEDDDDLHMVITADTTAKIASAKKLIQEIVNKAIELPEGQNDFKRTQLRDLAILNGTLRETRPYIPEDRQTRLDITKVVCKICKRVGHYARDCRDREELGGDAKRRKVDDIDSYRPHEPSVVPEPSQRVQAPPPGLPSAPYSEPPPGLPQIPHSVPPPPGLPTPPPGLPTPPPGIATPPPGLPSLSSGPTIAPPPPPQPHSSLPQRPHPPASVPLPAGPPPASRNRPPPPPQTNKPPPPPESSKPPPPVGAKPPPPPPPPPSGPPPTIPQ